MGAQENMLEVDAMTAHNHLTPLIKWAGGKERELKYIRPLLPSTFQRYYEPFVGGGAVFFSVSAQEKLINDRSGELVQFYRMVAQQNSAFLHTLDVLALSWTQLSAFADVHSAELVTVYRAYSQEQMARADLERSLLDFLQTAHEELCALGIFADLPGREFFLAEVRRNLFRKTRRMRLLEQQKWPLPATDVFANLEAALKSAFYMYLRHLYNALEEYQVEASVASALFFFVRENAYASMFRYNQQGKFNVPYGGISYNRKDLTRKVASLRTSALQTHLQHTVIEDLDFEIFLERYPPQAGDFLFLDPPYDSNFSTYMRHEFVRSDQERLADYLLNRCAAQFLLVIKHTPFIQALYQEKGLFIQSFEKRYLVSFQDRNNRSAEHLCITNYPVQ